MEATVEMLEFALGKKLEKLDVRAIYIAHEIGYEGLKKRLHIEFINNIRAVRERRKQVLELLKEAEEVGEAYDKWRNEHFADIRKKRADGFHPL